MAIYYDSKKLKDACIIAFHQNGPSYQESVLSDENLHKLSTKALLEIIRLFSCSCLLAGACESLFPAIFSKCYDCGMENLKIKNLSQTKDNFWNEAKELMLAFDYPKYGINNFIKYPVRYDIFPSRRVKTNFTRICIQNASIFDKRSMEFNRTTGSWIGGIKSSKRKSIILE